MFIQRRHDNCRRRSWYVFARLTQYAQLPDKLSYSPLHISHGPQPTDLARRDLFDVRFQILNEEGKFADADSDLIPGVYEGMLFLGH